METERCTFTLNKQKRTVKSSSHLISQLANHSDDWTRISKQSTTVEAFQDGVRLTGDAVYDAYAKSWVRFPEDVDIRSRRLHNQSCDEFKVTEKYNRVIDFIKKLKLKNQCYYIRKNQVRGS